MIEAAMIALLILGFLLLFSGGKEKKRSPAPSAKPRIVDSEDYQVDAIADLTLKLSDTAKRQLIKQIAKQIKRSKFAKSR